jgi:hypothetical protein
LERRIWSPKQVSLIVAEAVTSKREDRLATVSSFHGCKRLNWVKRSTKNEKNFAAATQFARAERRD